VRASLGQAEAGWSNFQSSQRFLRATASGLPYSQKILSESEKNKDKIENELKEAMRLKGVNERKLAVLKFQNSARNLHRAAVNRFNWEVALLIAAARAGLIDQALNEVQGGESRPDEIERQPFLASAAPWVIANLLDAAGQKPRRDELLAAANGRAGQAIPEQKPRIAQAQAERLVAAGEWNAGARLLNDFLGDSGTCHEFALRLACRLVKAGKPREAISFVRELKKDLGLREDGQYLISAYAARSGHSAVLWKSISQLPTAEPTTAALYAGIVTGLAHATGK
jgi:hypothetical protein